MASATAVNSSGGNIQDVPPSFTDVATTHSASVVTPATATADLEHDVGYAHEAHQQQDKSLPAGEEVPQRVTAAAAAAAPWVEDGGAGGSGAGKGVPEDTDLFSHVTLGEGECGPVGVQQVGARVEEIVLVLELNGWFSLP